MWWLLIGSMACRGSPGAVPEVTHIDQVAWLEALRSARPALMRDVDRSVHNPAWQAFVIAPEYRQALLDDLGATYATIVAAEYDVLERKADRQWAEEHGGGIYAYRRVGHLRPGPFVYKSFFGFRDGIASLQSAELDTLQRALQDSGFRGAFKVDLRPGAVRFQYHQLILYAETETMAHCGEHIVQQHAGSDLRHTARGVDAPPPYTDGVKTAWHHLLLRDAWDRLPPDIQRYVRGEDGPSTPTLCFDNAM